MIMDVSQVAEESHENENELEKMIATGNGFLRVIGLKLDSNDVHRNLIERLRFRYLFIFTFLCMTADITGQSTWVIGSFFKGYNNLFDITFIMPCLTITLMGYVKSFYFFKYTHHIQDIITILKKSTLFNNKGKLEKIEKKCVNFLKTANRVISLASVSGIIAFGVGPLVRMAVLYYKTGEIKLFFPFIFSYPFNAFDIRIWPFLYAQQVWSTIVTACTIWGPDYVGYALSTFIIIKFNYMEHYIINLIPKSSNGELFVTNDAYRDKFQEIVKSHIDLMRCAELIEASYTKTILFNVIASSLLLCFSLFNITINDNIVLLAPFTALLIVVLVQILLLCYFGDMIMRSSMEISDAVYKCRWYISDTKVVKDFIFMSLRANKPCKITAYGYSDVNLNTFTKILSTSWSYFALLQTVYYNNKG